MRPVESRTIPPPARMPHSGHGEFGPARGQRHTPPRRGGKFCVNVLGLGFWLQGLAVGSKVQGSVFVWAPSRVRGCTGKDSQGKDAGRKVCRTDELV